MKFLSLERQQRWCERDREDLRKRASGLIPSTRRDIEAMFGRPLTDHEAAEWQTAISRAARAWADEIDERIAAEVYAKFRT